MGGGNPIEVAYSGGKDSDVILQLAKEAGINYRAIYKNTTIDPPGTIAHAKEMGAEIMQPRESFFQLVAQRGFPNRMHRFCCGYLKEYKVLDKCVMGVRKSESSKRTNRYNEPTECRYYGKKTPENHVEVIYPILDWTTKDVAEFLKDRGIKCAPVYYDEEGKFHPERRLGCIGCPLASVNLRLEMFKKYPNMVKAYIKNGKRFLDTHPDSKVFTLYENVYEWFARDVFFEAQREWDYHHENMFGEKVDYKSFLEEYFKIKL